MQDTRQKILDHLKTHGEATVEELRDWLGGITAVTVRHHLDVLRRDGLVDTPAVERRDTPGRPRYVYTLTKRASEYFPKNYRNLTDHLLEEITSRFDERQASILLKGVAERIAAAGPPHREGETFEERLQKVVQYLTRQGYVAHYEAAEGGGFLLHNSNCPYDRAEGSDECLCMVDLSLITSLMGVVPRRVNQITQGDNVCSYFFPSTSP